jgi:plasmid stability protein
MSSLTIKNIPDNILNKLRRRAKLNRRSLNSEIIKNLEATVNSTKVNTELLIEKANKMRAKLNFIIDEKSFTKFKNEGRA